MWVTWHPEIILNVFWKPAFRDWTRQMILNRGYIRSVPFMIKAGTVVLVCFVPGLNRNSLTIGRAEVLLSMKVLLKWKGNHSFLFWIIWLIPSFPGIRKGSRTICLWIRVTSHLSAYISGNSNLTRLPKNRDWKSKRITKKDKKGFMNHEYWIVQK